MRLGRNAYVVRRRFSKAAQIVVNEGVRARRVRHLRQSRDRVVGVAHPRQVGIGLAHQPVERVIGVRNRLPFPVRFRQETTRGVLTNGDAKEMRFRLR